MGLTKVHRRLLIMSSASMSLYARQSLALSPAMQHAVSFLQMSSIELAVAIREALESNPFLEEPTGEDAASDTARDDSDAEAPTETEDSPQETELLREDDWFREQPLAAFADARYDPFATAQPPRGLREHLRDQLWAQPMSDRDRLGALIIIESLEDDGYLRDDLDPIAEAADSDVDAQELLGALRIVQSFDPSGIAARDLAECLRLQLRARGCENPLAARIVASGLELLALRDYALLASRYGVTTGEVHEAHRIIRTLDPKPGLRFAPVGEEYVEPDLVVTDDGRSLKTQVNPSIVPRIGLNRRYIELMRHRELRDHSGLRQQLLEARWMLRHSRQRFDTLQRVGEAIVRRQRAFFSDGPGALKPLMLKQIADDLDLHLSTVSRATANKYVATPRGVFELKYFFPRVLQTQTGATGSSAAVKNAIREMIAAEPAGGIAQSDVALTRRLRDSGIFVARRTVTKYRNAMRIVPAELRGAPG